MTGSMITFKMVKILPLEVFHFTIFSTNNCLVLARNHLDCGKMVLNKKDKIPHLVELNF